MNRDFTTQMVASHAPAEREQPAKTVSNSQRMKPLPLDFAPTADDVICGRGKKCYNHIGNERFRRRVIGMLDEYRKTRSKLEKSKVLSDVVEQVRQNSPLGGFVKQDEMGRWYEVGDFLAREKTSQAFRDALHDNYKSSNVAKKKRRQEEQSKASVKASKLARSDFDMLKGMDKLTASMGRISRDRASHHNFETRRVRGELRDDYGSSSAHGVHPELRLSEQNTSASGYTSEDSILRPYRSTSGGRGSGMESSRNNRPRAHSVPSSPATVPTIQEEEEFVRDLHHSMPDMRCSFSGPSCRIDEYEEMHHSLPNMNFDADFDFEPEEPKETTSSTTAATATTTAATAAVDPIPLGAAFAPREQVPSHAGSSMEKVSSRAPPNDASESISRDLILCLEKLTESTIADPDDPFAPIPLSPQAQKRRPSLAVDKSDFPKVGDPAPSSTFDEV